MNRPLKLTSYLVLKVYRPLEQGLRLLRFFNSVSMIISQSVSTARTRINTETFCSVCWYKLVKVYLPLEQGLRPATPFSILFTLKSVKVYLPLEQGLRH